jgi:1,4-alpha-glucan branching enzyme
MTPALHSGYWLRLPGDGLWAEVINSDAAVYGGSGQGNMGQINASGGGAHVTLPPLSTIMLEYRG